MGTELEAGTIVPRESGIVETAHIHSFTEALEILESNDTRNQGLIFIGPIILNKGEENSLRLLPKAFGLNRTIQKLWFQSVKVDHILIVEALRAGFKKDIVSCITFWRPHRVTNQRLLETMCEGIQERSAAFELVLGHCSAEFAKPIIEASYSKCFSLWVGNMDFSRDEDSAGSSKIRRPLKNLLLKGSLYYISLTYMTRLKDDVFVQLGKCLLPGLTKLDLRGTELPSSALKCLHGSLKKILDSGRSNMLERLDLGANQLGDKLCYAYFKLLRSDLISVFNLELEKDISRAAVKLISSAVANTKNLVELDIGWDFSSGTKFSSFNLQEKMRYFNSPFGVNPTVALNTLV